MQFEGVLYVRTTFVDGASISGAPGDHPITVLAWTSRPSNKASLMNVSLVWDMMFSSHTSESPHRYSHGEYERGGRDRT
jgi:hypothetical protein